MAQKNSPRFFDINHLIRERENLKNLRCKIKEKVEQNQRNQKRVGDNMYLNKNKVYHFKFNQALLPQQTAQAEIYEPNVKRRNIENEDVHLKNDFRECDMDVEAVPVSSETLLSANLEVVSAIPPEVILEPSRVVSPIPPEVILEPSTNSLRNAEYTFDPSWKPSVPEPACEKNKNEEDDIHLMDVSAQNFQASSGYIDKYKTCFKRRGDLRMKDAVNTGEEDVSLDHPRMKSVTSYLRNLQKQDNLQHWNNLKDQICTQTFNDTNIQCTQTFNSNFNEVSKSNNVQYPEEFFNKRPTRNDKLTEYVKNL